MSGLPVVGDVVKAVDDVVANVEGGDLCSTPNPDKPPCGVQCRCKEKAGHDGDHVCGNNHNWVK